MVRFLISAAFWGAALILICVQAAQAWKTFLTFDVSTCCLYQDFTAIHILNFDQLFYVQLKLNTFYECNWRTMKSTMEV